MTLPNHLKRCAHNLRTGQFSRFNTYCLLGLQGEEETHLCLISERRKGCSPMNVVVFSGGTAMNSVASKFQALTTHVTHILPVSDDGGSTAEIVRVLGGPAVGDIRSRCLRLADSSDNESRAVARLLAHRLHSTDALEAKREWMEIVEGESCLWNEVR
jgi:hypothetical protein